ncbi:ATPase-like protein, putative [Trypanosoma equiperdum]|uniref:ATPase-like protein, putative n=2 Tax=Trypanozoon TaxID=39700 RepID=Q384B2_TRYB2|nr:uncharacterized protein Tb11.01.0900 [Trypanosoma brucei brucei TREU927]EAN79869.1 ATPase-like protein, putative [Trypanosoma brucei brucei TREU927]SCU65612.1 ATPase-like protein, putative [Trypanosoma equiperdum]
MEDFVVVPVEVRCRQMCTDAAELSKVITSFIRHRNGVTHPGDIIPLWGASELITSTVELLRVCDVYCPLNGVAAGRADYALVMYYLHGDDVSMAMQGEETSESQALLTYRDSDDEVDASTVPCSIVQIPHASLEGLWESMHFGDSTCDTVELKRDLLQYMHTAMVFSMADVNPQVIAWNQLVLLHGPPGTGKTSFCKALSHKLSIRLAGIFPKAKLVEVNTQSLFSRWFSESGKHVMGLFRRIHTMAEDSKCLLFVLVDEVESLAGARNSAMRGNEPSDAIRVVNTLLTQLDILQKKRNVVILATSNITGAIDVAFVDRADKKVFIGPPGLPARLQLIRASTQELVQRRLIMLDPPNDQGFIGAGGLMPIGEGRVELNARELQRLELVAAQCDTFSGRTLKKLPFLAYSKHIGGSPVFTTGESSTASAISFDTYIKSLTSAVEGEILSRRMMVSS